MALKLALIGLKGHWYAIAEELPHLPDVRLVAVADDEPGMSSGVDGLPGATAETRTYLDYRELLDREEPDIVVEAGTDRDRAGILLACAERGVHFLCEKPMARTPD